jgi:cell wall-associated NlpC family hydrolase
VQVGDSLWRIARTYDTSPAEIASLNGLNVDAPLRQGQALRIPGRPQAAAAANRAPVAPSQAARSASSQPAPNVPSPQPPVAPAPTPPVPAASTPVTPAPAPAQVHLDPQFEDGLAASLPTQPSATVQTPPALQPVQPQPSMPIPAPGAPPSPNVPPVSPKAPAVAIATPKPEKPLTAAERNRIALIPSRGERWTSGMFALAMRFLGVRYVWGGTTPRGFDCSGFMQYVFARMGVALPRTTFDMFAVGATVPTKELRAGDLVFFETVSAGPSHAGIYLGDGRFIHASSGYGGVTITPMSKPYYQARYLGARRF